MKTTTKGSVAAVVIVVLALINGGQYAFHKLVEPGRNKKVAEAAAQTAADAQAKAKAAEETAKAAEAAAKKAQEDVAKERALRDQIDQNASGFVEGAIIAHEADPAPSQADVVALGLLESARQALGQPLTEQQRAFWKKTVAGLIAKNAEAEAKVRQLTEQAAADRAALTEVKARAIASETEAAALTTQVREQSEKLVKATSETEKLTSRNREWAEGQQTLWGRFKAFLWLTAIVVVLLIIVVGWISIKFRGVSQTLHDSVALGEHLKSIATTAVGDAKAVEEKIENWWENDTKAKSAHQRVKSLLRL